MNRKSFLATLLLPLAAIAGQTVPQPTKRNPLFFTCPLCGADVFDANPFYYAPSLHHRAGWCECNEKRKAEFPQISGVSVPYDRPWHSHAELITWREKHRASLHGETVRLATDRSLTIS